MPWSFRIVVIKHLLCCSSLSGRRTRCMHTLARIPRCLDRRHHAPAGPIFSTLTWGMFDAGFWECYVILYLSLTEQTVLSGLLGVAIVSQLQRNTLIEQMICPSIARRGLSICSDAHILIREKATFPSSQNSLSWLDHRQDSSVLLFWLVVSAKRRGVALRAFRRTVREGGSDSLERHPRQITDFKNSNGWVLF